VNPLGLVDPLRRPDPLGLVAPLCRDAAANAILLTFIAPLWMPVIAWLVFRQKASTATWIGAAMGFVGVVLVLGPQHNSFNVGALFALAGALLLAIALMSVRWLGATEPMSRILFYYFLLSTVMGPGFTCSASDLRSFSPRFSLCSPTATRRQ
jgi:drug/metabolite transporter (DMT)-like permease